MANGELGAACAAAMPVDAVCSVACAANHLLADSLDGTRTCLDDGSILGDPACLGQPPAARPPAPTCPRKPSPRAAVLAATRSESARI